MGYNHNPKVRVLPYSTVENGITLSNNLNSPCLDLELINNDTFQALQKKVEDLEKRLCVLHPNDQLHEQYPALKDAYDSY